MREHKYRAWDVDKKRMSEVFGIHWSPDGMDLIIEGDRYIGNEDDYFLMEYIGLLDKNRMKICEGDVVKGFFLSHGGTRKSTEYIGIIEWSDLGACFVVANEKFGTGPGMHFHDGGQEYEVIGNIHENPEFSSD